MLDNRSITGRYVGLFLLGWLLFSYPVLTIFNSDTRLFGIPLLFLYIFLAWLFSIIGIVLSTRIPDIHRRPDA